MPVSLYFSPSLVSPPGFSKRFPHSVRRIVAPPATTGVHGASAFFFPFSQQDLQSSGFAQHWAAVCCFSPALSSFLFRSSYDIQCHGLRGGGNAIRKKKPLETFPITEIVECPFCKGWHGGNLPFGLCGRVSQQQIFLFRRLPRFGRL
jgi:hypothetical protein